MLNQRLAAAQKVAGPLFNAEAKIDAAVTSTAALIVAAIEARQDANLPACIGQDALEAMGSAVTTLLRSRRDLVTAHAGLAEARDHIGLSTVSFGDQFPKPSPNGKEQPAHSIRAVA